MGLLNDLKQGIQDAVSFPGSNDLNNAADNYANDRYHVTGLIRKFENIYSIDWQNWYKALPYGFRYRDKKGQTYDFYLPLAPNNIQTTTHFATNVIPTMYGTVEEHSEQRYFDIVISGTTGMAPKYFQPKDKDADLPSDAGRKSFEISGGNLSSGVSGFFRRTGSLFKNALGSATAVGSDVSQLFGGSSKKPPEVSAIDERKSGYTAFHNFYRFLLLYKKEVAAEDGNQPRKRSLNDTSHPLQFLNYKDAHQYNVAITSFQLVRSAEDPMLYNYVIIMRAYDIRQVDKATFYYTGGHEELGLDGVDSSSKFSLMNDAARKAKNAAYGAVAAFKGIGS